MIVNIYFYLNLLSERADCRELSIRFIEAFLFCFRTIHFTIGLFTSFESNFSRFLVNEFYLTN